MHDEFQQVEGAKENGRYLPLLQKRNEKSQGNANGHKNHHRVLLYEGKLDSILKKML